MEEQKMNLPCEVIEDLLPSYTEELTNEVTNKIVSEHLAGCEKCSQKYRSMKNPVAGETYEQESAKKEIDYLKKTKKKTRGLILGSAALVLLAAVVFICIRFYALGYNVVNADYLAYKVAVSDNRMNLQISSPYEMGISGVKVSETEGVVEVTVRVAEDSIFSKKSKQTEFAAPEPIRQIWIGDRIIWANGETISPLTSRLYDAYNPYVGNMPDNGKIVEALNMTLYTGTFTNELKTSSEPYGWTMYLEKDFSSKREGLEERFKAYAYILLADIGNLDEIVFEYSVDGNPASLSITAEEASLFAGCDIKSVAEDINKLEALVRKSGLLNVATDSSDVESNLQVDWSMSDDVEQVLQVDVVNFADDKISAMFIHIDVANATGGMGTSHADGSAFRDGEITSFQLLREDFGEEEIANGTSGQIRLTVCDMDGNTYEVQGEVNIDISWGTAYRVNLSGNAENGYFIGK